jgi:tetratricopeptide (TPR) repeat protein
LIGLHADRPHAYAHVIAPLLRRAGRGEAAAHFEKLCGIASSQTLLRSQAHRLIAEGEPRPDPNEERAAVELLEAAVWALVDVDSFVETLTIAEHARRRAEHLDPPSPSLLATLLGFEARLYAGLGRADESAAAFDAAERAAATGPRDLLGRILVMRVTTEGDTHATDTDQIRRTLDRAERLMASLGRRDGVGICMYCRSKLAVIEGRTEAARELAENARRLVPHGSEMYWAATMAAGETTFALGRRRQGRALLEQALAGLREFDKQGGVAATLRILARADVTEGDLESARQHAMAAQEIFAKTMDRYGEAALTRTLAEIAWAEGRADAAIATLERACRMHETLGDGQQLQECNDLRQQYEKQRTGGLGKPPDLVESED